MPKPVVMLGDAAAREYGIPAVLMTREGTLNIRDGDTITVDGDEGVVELNS